MSNNSGRGGGIISRMSFGGRGKSRRGAIYLPVPGN
jgi:hypothetical protein